MKRHVHIKRTFTLVVAFVGLVSLLGLNNPSIGRVSAQKGVISAGDMPEPRESSEGPSCLMTPPCLDVEPAVDKIYGYEWPENVYPTIITVDDPGTVGLDYSGSTNSDFNGRVELDLSGVIDIQAGYTVTMTYETNTRTTIVKALTIDSVHEDTDAVDGTAAMGTDVHVLAMNYTEEHELTETASEVDGHWTGWFGDYVDIGPGTDIIAYQPDDDGDTTSAMWSIPSGPTFVVNLNLDYIWTVDWPAYALIDISIEGTLEVNDGEVGDDGNYYLSYDVQPGQIVSITDGITTKTHTTGTIGLTKVDQDNDQVIGTAIPGAEINFGWDMDLVANSSGVWVADFTAIPLDLKPGMEGYSQLENDEDGDYTEVFWASNDDIRFPTRFESVPNLSYLDTTEATHDGVEDDGTDPSFSGCGQDVGLATVWYKYEATTDGEMALDTMGSNYNTMLGVWSGSPSALTLVGCNNDALGGVQSQLHIYYNAGTDYYIGVAQKGTVETGGEMKLHATTFVDVPGNNPHWRNIEGLYAQRVTGGCSLSPLNYCPNNGVTRQQMAVFLLRSMFGSDYTPPAATGIFTDVPVTSFYAPWIEELYHQGITGGCSLSPLNYCPTNIVTRQQMAVFLLRAKEGSAYTPPPATGVFTDVPVTISSASWIEELYERGITGGCSTDPLMYCPANPVTRGQMGTFIVRMFEFPPLP